MRYQMKPYSCGAAAVVNALRCLGKNISEKNVRKLAFTTEEKGTDEHGIISSLRQLGRDGTAFEFEKFDEAFSELESWIDEGYPVIICTWSMQHWVTVVGKMGRSPGNGVSFIVVDPSNSERNTRENGVKVMTKKQLKVSWKSREKKFFGIACT